MPEEQPLRIAWTGPVGSEGGPWFATTLLRTLLNAGHQVDLYLRGDPAALPDVLTGADGLGVVAIEDGWQWSRWYSRTMATAFITSALVRLRAYVGLRRELARRHALRPYDVVFQLSQPETFLSRRALTRRFPPLVVHPCSHAAGELRWVRAEAALGRRCEPLARRVLARSYLRLRAAIQRRELRKADLVIGPSRRFLELLCGDYGLDHARTAVLRHPIDLQRFSPGPDTRKMAPVTLLFVSRFSARKGVELVVELSHRLADLADRVRIEVYGGPTMWSDYTRLFDDLNPDVAQVCGGLPAADLVRRYHTADALILPSRYEPGALVVGEALATGLPVVVSDQVGPGEILDARICRRFPDGDIDAFEVAVRGLLDDLQRDEVGLRQHAMRVARAEFSPAVLGSVLDAHLRRVAWSR